MTITIVDGCAEDTFRPAGRYAEIAQASRAMGLKIADDDYEKIDAMLESNSTWTVFPRDTAADLLVAGYSPSDAMYTQAIAN